MIELGEILEADGVEVEGVDASVSPMREPFDPTLIKIDTKTPSLDTLIKRIARDEIQMDTEKYFQRKDDLWTDTQQSRLIESILIQFPLPAFFFDASKESNWLIVDGLQRLSSIRNFCVKKTLRLTNLEFLTQLDGMSWDDLSPNLQREIEEAQMVIYKILPGTPTAVKFNIFKRINTGGLSLTSQEIRHALFQTKPALFITELARDESFLEATAQSIKTDRMLDREFANRFLAFYLLGTETFESDLDTFLSVALAKVEDLDENELSKIRVAFQNAMKLATIVFGNEAFRKIYQANQRRPPINKALFDAISTQFALCTQSERELIASHKVKVKNILKHSLSTDDDFLSSVSSSTDSRAKVKYRHDKVKTLIQTIVK